MWFCTSGVVSLLLPPEKGHVALVFWVRAAAGVTLLSLATLDTWHGAMSDILYTKKMDKLDSSKIFWNSFLNMFEIFNQWVLDILHLKYNYAPVTRVTQERAEGSLVASRAGDSWFIVTTITDHWVGADTGETAASLPRYRELLEPRDKCDKMWQDAS